MYAIYVYLYQTFTNFYFFLDESQFLVHSIKLIESLHLAVKIYRMVFIIVVLTKKSLFNTITINSRSEKLVAALQQ